MIVSTEIWSTRKGVVIKAVVRDPRGTFNGLTNTTRAIAPATLVK